jgi:endonuclease YncB( thermonuclease family)
VGAPARPADSGGHPLRLRATDTKGCSCHRDKDLNERIVREGWALDFRRYRTDYLEAEAAAKLAGAGIWRGEFTVPWEWRAARR